jgi:type 1 glutamine amidotransferase
MLDVSRFSFYRLKRVPCCLVGVWYFVSVVSGAPPHIVFVTGDHEYGSERTMPLLAKELEKNYSFRTTVLVAMNEKGERDENYEKNIPGLAALTNADLAIFFLRWRLLPADQIKRIEDYLKSGKPVVGFRTTSHSFHYPAGDPLEKWNAFGQIAFGTPPGWGAAGHTHYGHDSSTDVFINPAAARDPILRGVATNFHVRSWLYHVMPDFPPPKAVRLLIGKAVNPNKAAVDNPVAWTWTNEFGGRAFYTSMGHPEDFSVEPFQRLVVNGVHWALGKTIPKKWRKMEINVSYEKPKK